MSTATISALVTATRQAYRLLSEGADPEATVAGLAKFFEPYGLDADVAESALDWIEGPPGLLIESLADALDG